MIGDAALVGAIVRAREGIEASAGSAVAALAWSLAGLMLTRWLERRWRRALPGGLIVSLGGGRIAIIKIGAGGAVIGVVAVHDLEGMFGEVA